MPAPYVKPIATELSPNDGIVERARAILANRGHAVPPSPPASPVAPIVTNPLTAANDWREQARDALQALLRILEQLPASPPNLGQATTSASPLGVGDATLPTLRTAVAEPGRIATTALGLVNDARGGTFVRVDGVAADIGAYEVQGPNADLVFRNGFDP